MVPEPSSLDPNQIMNVGSLKFRNAIDLGIVNSEVPWILEDLLSEGEQMLIFGAPKAGKSQFALQLAIAVALDYPFLKWKPYRKLNPATGTQQGMTKRKVFYVNLEIDERPFMRRVIDHANAYIYGEEWEYLSHLQQALPGHVLEIDYEIRDHFFFSHGLRSIKLNENLVNLAREGNEWDDAKFADDPTIKCWHNLWDQIKPDLVIFDTLSKMHGVDEKDNNAIQGVMMLLRSIASVAEGPANHGSRVQRRRVAHIVIHHTRKEGTAFRSETGDSARPPELDSIRGGSAIRAEADVIIGIGGTVSRGMRRTFGEYVLEARNVRGEEGKFRFDGVRFSFASEDEVQAEATKKDTKHANTVLNIFKESKSRGIAVGTLASRLAESSGKKLTKNAATAWLKKFSNGGQYIRRLAKKQNKELLKTAPVLDINLRGDSVYWIVEGSPLLEIEEIKGALATWASSGASQTGAGDRREGGPVARAAKPAAAKRPRGRSKKPVADIPMRPAP